MSYMYKLWLGVGNHLHCGRFPLQHLIYGKHGGIACHLSRQGGRHAPVETSNALLCAYMPEDFHWTLVPHRRRLPGLQAKHQSYCEGRQHSGQRGHLRASCHELSTPQGQVGNLDSD